MKTAAAIGVAMATVAMTGCVSLSTPNDILQTGDRFMTEHNTSAAQTAECIVNHLDATETAMIGRAQPLAPPSKGLRIIVRALGQYPTTAAVIDATDSRTGSHLEWHLHPLERTLGTINLVMDKIRGKC